MKEIFEFEILKGKKKKRYKLSLATNKTLMSKLIPLTCKTKPKRVEPNLKGSNPAQELNTNYNYTSSSSSFE
jgi:hypothetical protein